MKYYCPYCKILIEEYNFDKWHIAKCKLCSEKYNIDVIIEFLNGAHDVVFIYININNFFQIKNGKSTLFTYGITGYATIIATVQEEIIPDNANFYYTKLNQLKVFL